MTHATLRGAAAWHRWRMSWIIACYCGRTFTNHAAGRCPYCHTPLPMAAARSRPADSRLERLLRSPGKR